MGTHPTDRLAAGTKDYYTQSPRAGTRNTEASTRTDPVWGLPGAHAGAPHTPGLRMEGRSSKITSHQETEREHEI